MTDPEHPLVTVVVPAWNAESTLAETLQSVHSQTYRNLEIIIVDDGSTDLTAEIAGEFCRADSRATLISQPNAGVAAARNRGIAEARGAWIAPVDADDLWHHTKIEKQVRAAAEAAEQPGFVYCWHRFIDEAGNVVGSGPEFIMSGPAFTQVAYRNPVANGSALLISRGAALAVGAYDSSLRARGSEGCEDVLLQLLLARDYPVAAVPEYLVGYRRHPNAMSRDNERIVRSWSMVYERMAAEGPLPPDLIRWNRGDVKLSLAENRAASGRQLEALRLLLGAMYLDPVRTASYLIYRLAHTSVRRLRRAPAKPRLRNFNEVDPCTRDEADPNEVGALARLLAAIDRRRLRRFTELDKSTRAARSVDRSGKVQG